MTLDDEILAVEDVVRVAQEAAGEHVERARRDLRLGSAALGRYEDFLGATVANARSAVARCRALVLVAAEASSANIVQGCLGGVRESVRLMYVAMTVVEQLAGAAGPPGMGDATGQRSCSFCGKTEAESKLVAGPMANICASCTRLACGVLGITER